MQVPAQGRAHRGLSSTGTKSSFGRCRAYHFQGNFPLVPRVSTSYLCPSWRRKYHYKAGNPLSYGCRARPCRLAHSEHLSQDAASLLVPPCLLSHWWALPTVFCASLPRTALEQGCRPGVPEGLPRSQLGETPRGIWHLASLCL